MTERDTIRFLSRVRKAKQKMRDAQQRRRAREASSKIMRVPRPHTMEHL